MIKKTILVVLISTATLVHAQNYRSALGVRLGFGAGLTFKGMFDNSTAMEIIAAYQYAEHGYTFTGLYEIHNYRITKTSHMALMYGGGAHVGYYDQGYYKDRSGIYYKENSFNAGLDGILGIDYYEAGSAINWSIDIKPMFDFVNAGFRFWDAGASIRYVIQ